VLGVEFVERKEYMDRVAWRAWLVLKRVGEITTSVGWALYDTLLL
jgi:hypothetical protein